MKKKKTKKKKNPRKSNWISPEFSLSINLYSNYSSFIIQSHINLLVVWPQSVTVVHLTSVTSHLDCASILALCQYHFSVIPHSVSRQYFTSIISWPVTYYPSHFTLDISCVHLVLMIFCVYLLSTIPHSNQAMYCYINHTMSFIPSVWSL